MGVLCSSRAAGCSVSIWTPHGACGMYLKPPHPLLRSHAHGLAHACQTRRTKRDSASYATTQPRHARRFSCGSRGSRLPVGSHVSIFSNSLQPTQPLTTRTQVLLRAATYVSPALSAIFASRLCPRLEGSRARLQQTAPRCSAALSTINSVSM